MYVELQIENHPDLKSINFWDEPFSHLSLCGICESDTHVDFSGLEESNDTWRLYFDGHFAHEDAQFCQKILTQWGQVSSKIVELENIDYNQSWKIHFKSIPVSPNLIITPWFEDTHPPLTQDSNCLYIYPGQGFGTGQHPTTHLCLQQIEKHQQKLNHGQVLDFGSGSGILGLAVLLLTQSKAKVTFLDIDPCANDNCIINIKLNHNRVPFEQTQVLEQLPAENLKYNAIIANILLTPILELESLFKSKLNENGLLILSGILNTQLPELLEFYENLGWHKVEMDILENWAVLTLTNRVLN